MSDQNIAAVRRLTQEGFVGGNVGVVDELVAEDCVDHDPMPGQGQGREGQRHTCKMVVEGLSDRSTLQDDLLAAGDTVVENWIFQGTTPANSSACPRPGKQLQVRGIEIWRLAGRQDRRALGCRGRGRRDGAARVMTNTPDRDNDRSRAWCISSASGSRRLRESRHG